MAIGFDVWNNDKVPNFKVSDQVKKWKYKFFFCQTEVQTEFWFEKVTRMKGDT